MGDRRAFGLSIRNLLWDPFKRPAPFVPVHPGEEKRAWEDTMVDATQYRAIAAEHHRLAGMCRSPESREQHLRLEREFLALADGKECLQEARAPGHASDPQLAK
jgi:hypothetical protein